MLKMLIELLDHICPTAKYLVVTEQNPKSMEKTNKAVS